MQASTERGWDAARTQPGGTRTRAADRYGDTDGWGD